MKSRIIGLMLAASLVFTGCNAGTYVRDINNDSADGVKAEEKRETDTEGSEYNGIIFDDGKPWIDSDLKINIDNSKKPDVKDDFHFAVNYEWLREAEIRDGYTSESSFTSAERNTRQRAMNLLTDTGLRGHDAELIRSLYTAVTDWDKRNEEGMEPVKPVLDDIRGIDTLDELSSFICDPVRSGCVSTFVSIANETSLRDSRSYITYINNDTLLLEDAAEYSELTSAGKLAYDAKKTLATALLTRLGMNEDEAGSRFDRVVGFEEKLASVSLTRADYKSADIFAKIDNVYSEAEIGRLTESFPLSGFINGFGYGGAGSYAVYQPEVIKRLDELYTEDNLDVMKDYMIIHYLLYASDKLDRECYELSVQRINTQYGTNGSTNDGEEAYNTILKLIPEPLERVYLEKYNAEKMKKDMIGICSEIIDGYREMIRNEDWLSEEAKAAAENKLSNMKINAVYPDKWIGYDTLDLKGLNYLECCREIDRFNADNDRSRTGQTVDGELWVMNILQCNAFYNKQDNSVNIILGILDDAFYNEDMSREEMLGGIGTVIGHEISHAFDEKGSQFDEEGNLKSWWTDKDHKAYDERTTKLITYYDSVTGFNGTNENGKNVKDEAVADIAGMKVVLSLAQKEDDFDYDKFFRQYADIWRSIMTPEAEYDKIIKDQHPLNYLRTNVTVAQFDEFCNTYDLHEGNGMYIAPEDRITVW